MSKRMAGPQARVDMPSTATTSRRWGLLLLACVIGIAFAWMSSGRGYIAGDGPFWQFPQGDAATGQIGWQYYARDDWRWPIFAVENYHAPEGSTVLLSDSLPLFALPAKLIYRTTGWLPGYVGFWVALCLVLQAVCASRLLIALGVVEPFAHVAGIALFCYLPIVLIRYGHATLMGHFLLLIALERYVMAKRRGLDRRGWIALCALPAIAMHTHPYMAAMCAALVFVCVVDQWRERNLSASGALVRLGGSAAFAVVLALCGGLFRGGGQPYLDYGVYSLNLAAPFVPLADTLSGHLLGTQQPNIPGIYQWEGTAYLGVGVLLLCVLALPALRSWRSNVNRHLVLLSTIVLLLIIAVSNRVGFGAHELLHVPLPDSLIRVMSVFRGSGRLVWVAVYALLGGVLVAIVRNHGPKRAAILLVLAAVLQIADIQPMQAAMRGATGSGAAATINRIAWTKLIDAHARLFEFPSSSAVACSATMFRVRNPANWKSTGLPRSEASRPTALILHARSRTARANATMPSRTTARPGFCICIAVPTRSAHTSPPTVSTARAAAISTTSSCVRAKRICRICTEASPRATRVECAPIHTPHVRQIAGLLPAAARNRDAGYRILHSTPRESAARRSCQSRSAHRIAGRDAEGEIDHGRSPGWNALLGLSTPPRAGFFFSAIRSRCARRARSAAWRSGDGSRSRCRRRRALRWRATRRGWHVPGSDRKGRVEASARSRRVRPAVRRRRCRRRPRLRCPRS
jgi:hypothetical protein